MSGEAYYKSTIRYRKCKEQLLGQIKQCLKNNMFLVLLPGHFYQAYKVNCIIINTSILVIFALCM